MGVGVGRAVDQIVQYSLVFPPAARAQWGLGAVDTVQVFVENGMSGV
jgi:hypothetical protein